MSLNTSYGLTGRGRTALKVLGVNGKEVELDAGIVIRKEEICEIH